MNKGNFFKGQVLWSQIDANRHLRHSAYADYATQARSNMLNEIGLSLDLFALKKIGPILFKEELLYYKEVKLDEYIHVSVHLSKLDKSNGRFSFRHLIYKENGTVAAEINVDGAWLDLTTRKLTAIPSEWYSIFNKIPQTEDYTEIHS
ncbi:acyl-CoA thioesterase [Sphingobacterium rhinopitheci]|uniref:acyl-CoA thioesterase n=1 Tax=Sphingobacterium rhinopitheci TaxID=2781960 RepID=UPI001F51E19E|nr:acyl-CoA thioesterase [Sphingobacterium rhinopitheci]MCI0919858.1 thioesterase family protein [Sphingobacterium rhinopitheci]